MPKGVQTFQKLDFERHHCKNIVVTWLKFITIMRASQKAAALLFHKKRFYESRMSFCGATNCVSRPPSTEKNRSGTFHESQLGSQAVKHNSKWCRSLSIFSKYDNKFQKSVCPRREGVT